MLAVGWTCEIRVCIRVTGTGMRHGRLGTINWADRLAFSHSSWTHVTFKQFTHRGGRHHAESTTGAPTTMVNQHDRASLAGRGSGGSTRAGETRPPRHRDPWVPPGLPAGGSRTILIHTMDIEGTCSRPGVVNPGRKRGGCSGWSWEKDAGIARLNKIEGGDRAEPDHDPRCTVGSWSRMCANR